MIKSGSIFLTTQNGFHELLKDSNSTKWYNMFSSRNLHIFWKLQIKEHGLFGKKKICPFRKPYWSCVLYNTHYFTAWKIMQFMCSLNSVPSVCKWPWSRLSGVSCLTSQEHSYMTMHWKLPGVGNPKVNEQLFDLSLWQEPNSLICNVLKMSCLKLQYPFNVVWNQVNFIHVGSWRFFFWHASLC